MSKTLHNRNQMLVDLKSDVLFQTNIPPENHAALRSGFAGYPANPRWNINKFQAWKTGNKLGQALKKGDLVVRSSDSLLVTPKEAHKLQKNHRAFVEPPSLKDEGFPYRLLTRLQQ